jgi:ammonia channel protein AmtB
MNTKNILMQNTLDTCISIVMYWVVGYGISRGDVHGNMGFGNMEQSATQLERGQFPLFIFLWAFCNAATTIVSGAVTSRIKFFAYMASCVLISGFTFPVVAYWVSAPSTKLAFPFEFLLQFLTRRLFSARRFGPPVGCRCRIRTAWR